MKKKYLLLAMLFFGLVLNAQNGAQGPVEMADGMRQNGKIYVVIAVIMTILIGLILYLVRIDRKVTQLEKETK